MLIALLPLLVAVVGLLMWALAGNALVKEAGRILFAAGVLVTLFVAAHYTVRLP